MNKSCSEVLIGIDVGKYQLVTAQNDRRETQVLENEKKFLEKWVKGLEGQCSIILEATGSYHLLIAHLLRDAGHRVFIVDGSKVSQYRKSVGQRGKTDPIDAKILLRYLQREYDELTVWQPAPENVSNIRKLLRRKAELVKFRGAIKQSLSDVPELCTKETVASLEAAIKQLATAIQNLLKKEDLIAHAKRCQQITGVGVLTSAALTSTYYSGTFTRADAFIAFLGMDLVPKDSGTKTGRRKLSKKGDSELRRLLHNAAMSACRIGPWKSLYESYLTRGLQRIQALVIVARKIARIAFGLLKTGANYDENLAFPSRANG